MKIIAVKKITLTKISILTTALTLWFFLYIKIIFANYIIMYWVFAIIILLIFPFLFGFKIYYNSNIKKVFVTIDLFGFISILSGYFTFKEGIIYFHYTNRRAIALRLLSTTTMIRGNSKFYKSIEVMSIYQSINLPLKPNYIFLGNSINVANSILFTLYKNRKPFIDIDNKITVGKLNHVEIFFQFKILLNIVVLITIIVRKLLSSIEI